MDLVLASTSRYRRELLERLGLPFRCRAPGADEDRLKSRLAGLQPRELARRLAGEKAQSSCADEGGATVIGCDQLVVFEGRVLGKPMTEAVAVEQLTTLAGRCHELVTALVI